MDFGFGMLGIGVLFGLMIHGWPKLFTINIHKHYHGKNGQE